MAGRVPQPPVNAQLRARESSDFWLAFILAVAAIILLVAGARNNTRVNSTDGASAREYQLIKAFSSGGLQASSAVTVPDMASYRDPAAAAAALERMARQKAESFPIVYRVNTGAADPCPT